MMFSWKEQKLQSGVLRVIEITPSLDLLSASGRDFVGTLQNEVDRATDPSLRARVIVCRAESDSQSAAALLSENDAAGKDGPQAFSPMVAYMLELREVLSRLQEDQIPWVFVGFTDCFDLLFELALSCRFRFLFGQSLKVGFPKIRNFMLPISKAHENLVQKNILTEMEWHKSPVRDGFDAFELGLLTAKSSDLSYAAADSVLENLEWLQRFLSQQDTTIKLTGIKSWFMGGKGEPVVSKPAARLEKNVASAWMLQMWQDLSVWLDQLHLPDLMPTKFFQLLEEKDRQYPREQRFFIRVFFHAYHATQCKVFEPKVVTSRDWYGTRIFVDCALLAPPERVLKALVNEKVECVFWHTKVEELLKSLQLLQMRWERTFSIDDTEKFWERYASWCVRQAAPEQSLRLSFTVDDFIHVNQQSAYRLSSNRGHAGLGIVEWFSPTSTWMDLPQRDQDLFKLLADAIVFTGGERGSSAPLAVLLRIIACEEIVRLGSQDGLSVPQVLEALKEIGWPILGEEKILDRFISRQWRKASFVGSALQNWQRSNEVKAVESMRQFKLLRADRLAKNLLTDNNAVIISEHFLFLAYALYRFLAKTGICGDDTTLKRLVAASLGLPPVGATIDKILTHFGTERLEYQIKSRWFWLVSQLS